MPLGNINRKSCVVVWTIYWVWNLLSKEGCMGWTTITKHTISSKKSTFHPLQQQQQQQQQQRTKIGYRNDYQGIMKERTLVLHLARNDDDGRHEGEEMFYNYYYATCLPGMQDVLCQELMQLGDNMVRISSEGGISNKGVAFEATREGALRALIWVRTCHSIMERVCAVDYGIETRQDLYYFIQDHVNWRDLLLLHSTNNNEYDDDDNAKIGTLMVQAILNNQGATGPDSDLTHSHYTALTVKNALVDMVRNDIQKRPDVDTANPDVPLSIVLDRNGGATLYRLLHHPSSLHKRGYRSSTDIHAAAMKETMAAGLLYMTGWDALIADTRLDPTKKACLMDPMTGSSTLCIEAALMAANIAPALMRIRDQKYHQIPPVVRWKQPNSNSSNTHNNMLQKWKQLLLEARQAMDLSFLTNQCIIMANERNPGAANLAKQGIQSAGFNSQHISLHVGNCKDWDQVQNAFPSGRTIVVANPPWGVRLTEDEEQSWIDLSDFLKNKCRGTEAWILSGGDKASTRLLRMKRTRMIPLQTGNLSLRWIQYHIFDKPPPQLREDRQKSPDFKEVQRKSKARVRERENAATKQSTTATDNSWD